MIIIGVDPGLQVTGLVVGEGSRTSFKLCYLEEIKTKSKSALTERIRYIYTNLERVVDKFRPSVLVLEKVYSHYRHPATSVLLGQVRGVIVLLAAEKNIKFLGFHPHLARFAF